MITPRQRRAFPLFTHKIRLREFPMAWIQVARLIANHTRASIPSALGFQLYLEGLPVVALLASTGNKSDRDR